MRSLQKMRGMYLQVQFHTSYPINSLQGGRFVLKFVAKDTMREISKYFEYILTLIDGPLIDS